MAGRSTKRRAVGVPVEHQSSSRVRPAPRGPVTNLLHETIFDMTALLRRVLEEIEGGLLTTIENHAIAVTFDDFLDQS